MIQIFLIKIQILQLYLPKDNYCQHLGTYISIPAFVDTEIIFLKQNWEFTIPIDCILIVSCENIL